MPMLFIYGTLRRGMPADMMMREGHFRGWAWLPDVRLADLGNYPGLVREGGGVLGELWEVSDRHLRRLDQYEDCFPERPDASLYYREAVTVHSLANGETLGVEAYFYALTHPARHVDRPCYRAYTAQKDSAGPFAVLAYGSNMSRARLEARVGSPGPMTPVELSGFRLAFNKTAFDGVGTVANAIWTGNPEDRLPARLFYLSAIQLAELDRYEGCSEHYFRTVVDVPMPGGSQPAHIYLGHPDRLGTGAPKPEYLAHIEAGYREAGFDLAGLERCL